MAESNPLLKKLQFKDSGQPVLIVHHPNSYNDVISSFTGEVHNESKGHEYDFVQIFGTANDQLKSLAQKSVQAVKEDGLFWICYPKKSSKTYKGSDCSRETVGGLLAAEGYEPVRQIAIDDDWSALRFRKAEKIKKMSRKFVVTDEGKQRTEQN
ncbi:DUF3052 domain-containing protein [Metabacillus litoralis]|uniref:DUF3052 domain-containing protein n=1 Tax=Metabacillus litoralis TaxID=152268 RepID=UPI00203E1D75|nr:DUF3052 domain-containing protein [Metabacillus litoralis]MCM3163977.1 DUF3052 domain-containing protein [Metabacillus litoralis]MCM3410472.1 DUF3052 domain-containing protein [Metabacillus litoralis]